MCLISGRIYCFQINRLSCIIVEMKPYISRQPSRPLRAAADFICYVAVEDSKAFNSNA